MSHDYSLYCPKCKAHSENEWSQEAKNPLITAVKRSRFLWELSAVPGWGQNVRSLEYTGLACAGFIIDHFTCGEFWIVSEYWTAGDAEREAKYPPVKVRPEMEPGEYEKIVLADAVQKAQEAGEWLAKAVVAAKAWC